MRFLDLSSSNGKKTHSISWWDEKVLLQEEYNVFVQFHSIQLVNQQYYLVGRKISTSSAVMVYFLKASKSSLIALVRKLAGRASNAIRRQSISRLESPLRLSSSQLENSLNETKRVGTHRSRSAFANSKSALVFPPLEQRAREVIGTR